MSRIEGRLLSQKTHPCSRLVVPEFHMDSAEQTLETTVPSSPDDDLVYGIVVDLKTGEWHCPCLDCFYRRKTKKGREEFGVYVEHLARIKGKTLLPLITRTRPGFCKHGWKVREALRRRGLLPAFKAIEESFSVRLEAMPTKREYAA